MGSQGNKTYRKLEPRLRPDAIYDISRAIELELKRGYNPIYKSCLSCEHFDEKPNEFCKKAGLRPPARIIAYGCPAWEDGVDEIPY